MSPPAVIDDLLTAGFVAGRIGEPGAADALWERLTAWTGLPRAGGRPAPRRAARARRTWRSRPRAGPLRSSTSKTSTRPPVAATSAPPRSAPPGRRRVPRPRRAPARAAPGLLSADGGRDGGDPPRRGRGGEGRGPREDRHVPVRGGQGPRAALEALRRRGAGRPRVGGPGVDPRRRARPSGSATTRAAVRLAACPRRGPPRPGDQAGGRLARPPGRHGPRASNATPRAVPRSTVPIATWNSGERPSCTRRSRSSNRCARVSTGCAVAWRDWADRWAGDFNALCKARGSSRRRAPAADDLRRRREAARPGVGDDGALRRRRPSLRDGRGALRDALRHARDDADAPGPARRAADRDGGRHERARPRRRTAARLALRSTRTGSCSGFRRASSASPTRRPASGPCTAGSVARPARCSRWKTW